MLFVSDHKSSPNLFPEIEFQWLDAQFVHPLQQIFDVRSFSILVEVSLGRPVFIKQKFRRIVRCDMQVVIDATVLLSGEWNQTEQYFAQFGLLAGARLKCDDECDLFCFHNLTQGLQ